MHQSSLHNAKSLDPVVRQSIEQLLGRVLLDNEMIAIRSYGPQEAPAPNQLRAASAGLRRYFAGIDEKAKDVTESEREDILEEAIRCVRPGFLHPR